MTTPLPINVDATDWTVDPDKGAVEHRQWHDRLHGAANMPFGTKGIGSTYRGMPGWRQAGYAAVSTAMPQYDPLTWPIFLPRAVTLTGWSCFVNGGNEAAKVLRLGVYAASGIDDGWQVSSLLSDTGTVSVAATGAQTKTGLSVALAAGWHQLAIVTDAAALALYCFPMSGPAQLYDLTFGSGAVKGQFRWWFDYTSSPNLAAAGLPSPLAGQSDAAGAFDPPGFPTLMPVNLIWSVP